MRAQRSPRFASAILAGCMTLVACGESTSPSVASVSGAYVATAFSSTVGPSVRNQLTEGASVTLTLTEQGATTGTLFIPGGNDDGSDFSASLAGTWTLNGRTVEFAHSADTFIRDMPFTVDGNRLVGDQIFDGVRIQLTLTKLLSSL